MATKLKAIKPENVIQGKSKCLIFGASGIGKTWFSLTFPTPYYIDTEGGADLKHYQERLEVVNGAYMGVAQGSLDFDTVISQMQGLATEAHPYKTLIIDSITKLYQTAIANEAERLGEKDSFGASKKPAIAKMRSLINWATKLDMNILLIAHEITEWGIINGQRQEVGKIADIWEKLIYELDLTLQTIKAGPSRYAIVRKSRLIGFPDNEKFELNYNEFSKRYGKDFIESNVQTITLATEEQIKEIERLVTVLNIPKSDIDKILTKDNAESFSEMTTKHAEKTLTWLNQKIKGEK